MRILVTGACGLLGTEVVRVLGERGHEVIAATHADLDIAEPESTAKIPADFFGKIDWCVNCAAYTAVDRAETEEQQATEVNGIGVGYLMQVLNIVGAKLLHVSTDFVFDGATDRPYTEEDETNPLGAYGRSKLVGERTLLGNPSALVVRTSWLFGPNGPCFPKTMLRAFDAGKTLKVVADQFGTPTYTPHLATTLADLIDLNPFPGTYHAAGPEIMSWCEFANRVIEQCRQTPNAAVPIQTKDWPTPARRPPYSALSPAKLQSLNIPPMPPLEVAISDFCSRAL